MYQQEAKGRFCKLMWSDKRSERSLPLEAKRGCCCHSVVDSFPLSEMIFMLVPYSCWSVMMMRLLNKRCCTRSHQMRYCFQLTEIQQILKEFKTQDRKHPVLYTRSLDLSWQGSSELVWRKTADPICSLKATPQGPTCTVHSPCTQDAPCRSFSGSLARWLCWDSVTLLRHSYISHMLAYGQLTIRDREQLAVEMCH